MLLLTSLFMFTAGLSVSRATGQAAATATAAAANPITPATISAFFDAMIAQQMAEAHVVGVTVAVVKAGELLFAKGYGYADLESKRPVVADQTLFYPGSTGKLLTWTALMQLVEQGKIALAADVNQYLDFTIPSTFPEPITIENLLTHTTGFEEQLAALLLADEDDVLPLGEFLRRNLPARVYPPGTTWAYSNYATGLAGYIIERVSGQPYADYVTEQILLPLGMTRSSVEQPLPAVLMADYAKGYHYRNGHYTSVEFEWVSNLPSGPLRTTATDMANFMLAHLNTDWEGVLFREELERLPQDLNLKVVHVLQNPPVDWNGEAGLMSKEIVDRYLPQNLKDFTYFVCGPEPMMDMVEPYLHQQGVPLRKIFSERFKIV